ncbi:MAG: hypothetical protein ACPGVY_12200 [Mycobacterium sp.]
MRRLPERRAILGAVIHDVLARFWPHTHRVSPGAIGMQISMPSSGIVPFPFSKREIEDVVLRAGYLWDGDWVVKP